MCSVFSACNFNKNTWLLEVVSCPWSIISSSPFFQFIPCSISHYLNLLSIFPDPKVVINLLSWRDDTVTLAVLGSVGLCLLLISLLVGFWFSKSRHRHIERLERRNSIRQSLQSVRSFSQISNGGFPAGEAYKRKPITMIAVSLKTIDLIIRPTFEHE